MPAVLWQFQLQFLIKTFFQFNQIWLSMNFDVKIVMSLNCGDRWLNPVTLLTAHRVKNAENASFRRQ
jgi:hypothetical protein